MSRFQKDLRGLHRLSDWLRGDFRDITLRFRVIQRSFNELRILSVELYEGLRGVTKAFNGFLCVLMRFNTI